MPKNKSRSKENLPVSSQKPSRPQKIPAKTDTSLDITRKHKKTAAFEESEFTLSFTRKTVHPSRLIPNGIPKFLLRLIQFFLKKKKDSPP